MGIVDPAVGRGLCFAFVCHEDALGSQCAHVQPDRGRAGAAIEGKSKGATGGIGRAILGVGNEKQMRAGFPGLVAEGQVTRGGGVVDLFPIEGDAVPGYRKRRHCAQAFVLLLLCIQVGAQGHLAQQKNNQVAEIHFVGSYIG